MKLINMFDTDGNEEQVPSNWVSDAIECGYSMDNRTADEYKSDKSSYGYSMAMSMMGCEL